MPDCPHCKKKSLAHEEHPSGRSFLEDPIHCFFSSKWVCPCLETPKMVVFVLIFQKEQVQKEQVHSKQRSDSPHFTQGKSTPLFNKLVGLMWLRVKNRYPKWHTGKWKQGPKPVVSWWFNFDPYPCFSGVNGYPHLRRNPQTGPLESCALSVALATLRFGQPQRGRLAPSAAAVGVCFCAPRIRNPRGGRREGATA